MSPLIVDKAEKKKQILEAALEVFIAKGYHNVNVSDIARQAGISKGALYIYFKSREELFRELFGFMAQTHRVRFGKKTTSHASPESKLRELISFYLQSYKKREKFLYAGGHCPQYILLGSLYLMSENLSKGKNRTIWYPGNRSNNNPSLQVLSALNNFG